METSTFHSNPPSRPNLSAPNWLDEDTHGHAAGDLVLRSITNEVGKLIRAEDVLARVGGEEFMVLVRGIVHANVVRFAERLRRGIERKAVPFSVDDVRVTISVGVAALSEVLFEMVFANELVTETDTGLPVTNALTEVERAARLEARLLELADKRLYEAKEGGRNRVSSGS